MYKEINKNEFLSTIENHDSKLVYKSAFKNSQILEEELKKDLFNFKEEDLERLIRDYIKPKTKQSARTYCNILSKYIQWGIETKRSKLDINPFRRRQDYYSNFVEDQSSLYLSKNQIDSILFGLNNAQDAFIVKASFAGIQGKEISEMTNLTIQDVVEAINNDNILQLKDKNGKVRSLKVDSETLNLAVLANKQETYYRQNGDFDYDQRLKTEITLPQSIYILKPTKTSQINKEGYSPISHFTVYNRLEMIKKLDEFKEFKASLTTKNLSRSGMIYEAKLMMDQGIELTEQALRDICKKYGMKYQWSLRDFLNEETVKSVYSENI